MNRWLTRLVIHSALPLAVVVAAAGSVAADDLIWDGDTDFFYDTPDNWDLGQNPSGGDHVLFDASASSFLVVPGTDSLAGEVSVLGGELLVSLVDGFSPSQGNSFEFLSAAGGLSGQFATLSLPALAGGLAWSIDSTATALTLYVRAGATLEADFDLDGDDFLVWQSGSGSGITHPEGDADRDGDVDGDDFLRWQSQFGSGAGSAASQPVPEPAAVGLIVLLFSAAACRRGRLGLRHFVIRHCFVIRPTGINRGVRIRLP